MTTPMIAISLQLAAALIPEIPIMISAIESLKARGATSADVTTLMLSLEASIPALNAETNKILEKK